MLLPPPQKLKMKKKFEKEIKWIINEKYFGDTKNINLQNDIARLKSGEPVDYIIGFKEFLGAKVDLKYRPLIPRNETEFWVENAVCDIKNDNRINLKCLDIFAGSGCIGIAVLSHIPSSIVHFAEIDQKNISQIRLNLKLNNVALKRYKIMQSDVFSNVKEKYDYIFSNPPYLPNDKKGTIEKSVINYEPHLAIFAGNNGLELIEKFLCNAKNYLNENGKIYMEFDPSQKTEITKLANKFGFNKCKFYQDQFKRWRWIVFES